MTCLLTAAPKDHWMKLKVSRHSQRCVQDQYSEIFSLLYDVTVHFLYDQLLMIEWTYCFFGPF